jgi:hypothetical protein
MVKHCRDLDGTELVVLDNPSTAPRPQCQTDAIHVAFQEMKGRPFIWIEPDSVPFKAGWRAAISAEYKKIKKPILMPDLSSLDKRDVASGIGVYPPESWWLFPKKYPTMAWDGWMEKHLQPIIGRTHLIQHNFRKYFTGRAEFHQFPRDKAVLDPRAMIFHKDAKQSLIDCFKDSPYVLDFDSVVVPEKDATPKFRHSGDLGDVIAAMPILRDIGGGDVILFHDPDAPVGMRARESMAGARYEALRPLLLAQPYVYSVEWAGDISVKEQGFRENERPKFESLVERQARHIGRWPIDLSPWLTVPDVVPHNRVVCCRSLRYHNKFNFPWKEAGQTYGDRLLFIGLPEEHKAFEGVLGRRVEHAKTEDFLQIGQIMAGAPQVIANQSSPLWVALGLGVKTLVEGNIDFPNSEVRRNKDGCFWAYTAKDSETVRRAFAAVKK